VRTDIGVADGKLAQPTGEYVDMGGALVLPAFVDSHTHLDKGHILPRASNPDGTFYGALNTVRADHANWSAEDVRTRAEFAIRGAYAQLAELRTTWAGRVDLQMASLVPCDFFDDPGYTLVADLVEKYDGVLGMVSYPLHWTHWILWHRLESISSVCRCAICTCRIDLLSARLAVEVSRWCTK